MNGEEAGSGAVMGGAIGVIITLGIMAVMVASMWKVFTKAGQPGWAAIVPIYNLVTMLKIAGKPTWWLVLFCIPLANFYALFMVGKGIAANFGKSTGFGMGLIFLGVVFFPILAFGDARYVGAVSAERPALVTA